MSYIPPMFVKTVIKLPAELMHTVKLAFEVQARHRDSPRESDRLVIHYAHLGCAYTSGLMDDESRSHISR